MARRLEAEGLYGAHPLTPETAYLADQDVWLSSEETPLARPVMIQSWLSLTVDGPGLDICIGRVSPDVLGAVNLTTLRLMEGGPTLDERVLTRLGPPMLGPRDPRYDFQRRELERWQPAAVRARARLLGEDAAASDLVVRPRGHTSSEMVPRQ